MSARRAIPLPPCRFPACAAVLLLGAALAAPAPAAAAVTRTTLATPTTSPTLLLVNANTGTSLFVAGTSNGGKLALDLRCDAGERRVVRERVEPNARGSWSVMLSLRELEPLVGRACYLHAVPAGSRTLNRSAYSGVVLVVSGLRLFTVAGGPNNGALTNFRVTGTQLYGRGQYSSAGACGLSNAAAFQPTSFLASTPIFGCSSFLRANAGTRSAVLVDGVSAFPAAAAERLFAGATPSVNVPGIVPLTYTAMMDPATGNTTIREVETLVRCNPAPTAFPPTPATCSSFVPAGIRLDRTWAQDHDGRFTVVTDSWFSTDGRPHRLDLLYENRAVGAPPAFNFPWLGATFPAYGPGYEVPQPPRAPASYYVRRTSTAGNDRRFAQGAVTFKVRPDVVRFRDASSVWLGYSRTVAARGAVRFSFAYSRATTSSEVATLAGAAEAALKPPPCVVPRVLGLTLRVARARLHAANCTIGRVRREYASKARRNRVKSQRPRAGTTLAHDGRVTLTLGRGRRTHR